MVTLDTTQQYDIKVVAELDAKGNSVPLPGIAFGFKVSDDTLGIFTVNSDGISGTFAAKAAGVGTITVSDPINPAVTAVSDFTVTGAAAASIQISESAPVPQP